MVITMAPLHLQLTTTSRTSTTSSNAKLVCRHKPTSVVYVRAVSGPHTPHYYLSSYCCMCVLHVFPDTKHTCVRILEGVRELFQGIP
jgi:hypothetical protein